jgi:hypothetical protein
MHCCQIGTKMTYSGWSWQHRGGEALGAPTGGVQPAWHAGCLGVGGFSFLLRVRVLLRVRRPRNALPVRLSAVRWPNSWILRLVRAKCLAGTLATSHCAGARTSLNFGVVWCRGAGGAVCGLFVFFFGGGEGS